MMIELATIRSVLSLLKDLLFFVERGKKRKRETFDRICKPLYERLEVVANDYYAGVSQATQALSKPRPNLKEIAQDLRTKRAALIIARDAVVGEAQAAYALDLPSYPPTFGLSQLIVPGGVRSLARARNGGPPNNIRGEFRKASFYFSESILQYFFGVRYVFEHYDPGPYGSGMSFLIDVISEIEDMSRKRRSITKAELALLRKLSRELCRSLEDRWREVARNYANCRLKAEY
jgi:hypothetical protein